MTTALCLVLPPFADVFHVQASDAQTAKPATPAPAPPGDGDWPRAYTTPSGAAMTIYQPQIATWENQKHMVAYSAVSYTAKGAKEAALGTVRIEADTKVALDDRLVNFSSLRIAESHFPTLPKEQLREVVAEVDKGIPDEDRVIALDRVLANIDHSQILPKNVEGVKADPPVVFFSSTPAVLVNLDSAAVWSPIKDNDLQFAVNTNWDLFQHTTSKTFYLLDEGAWLKATSLDGPWAPAGTLPESFAKLPADENFKEVKAAVPGKRLSGSKVPKVFVSEKPAELILTTGAPSYVTVGNTPLLWVNNTDRDVFRLGKSGAVYFLVAGRWFSAPDFTGPWTFATPTLPAEFKQIPLEHPRSRVLASVPGTQQAAEAVLLAQVPQTARVNSKELKAPEVSYQGDPQFEPVPQTSVARAVNTDKDIIKVGDLYYMCFQGVWFMSTGPTGPWTVTAEVPKQIYEIPASSPANHVTYVTVEESSNDGWVTFAAAAGYTGMMIAWGCAVWGSGWYYPPYIWHGGYYPVYYPHFPTYGYAAYYNPWTGTYGRGAVAYGPYGGAGVGARYNPRTGTYARGAAAYGPYGARGAAQAYNPRTGTYAQTRQGAGVYGSWGTSSVQRGDDWAQTARATNRVTGNTTRVTRTDEGAGAVTRRGGPGGPSGVARTEGGDVYAGRDGNVYRRQDGSWQKHENGGWNNVQTPTRPEGATMGNLERDRAARAEGAQRTRDYGSYRSGSGGRAAGSYRHAGGGRAGGRRR